MCVCCVPSQPGPLPSEKKPSQLTYKLKNLIDLHVRSEGSLSRARDSKSCINFYCQFLYRIFFFAATNLIAFSHNISLISEMVWAHSPLSLLNGESFEFEFQARVHFTLNGDRKKMVITSLSCSCVPESTQSKCISFCLFIFINNFTSYFLQREKPTKKHFLRHAETWEFIKWELVPNHQLKCRYGNTVWRRKKVLPNIARSHLLMF